jgi:CheY-like chemotaxis protein
MGRLLGLGARDKRRIRLDLAEPLRQAADLVSAGAGLAVSVETDLPETPVMADADPGDVLHLALNLGVNARDALGAEGGRITLALRAANARRSGARHDDRVMVDPTRAYAVISVEDEGKGVPPELVKSIFKPHVSTKGDAGTGLGLAIVAGVLAENDAALALTSEPEKGALFEIFWPLIARTDVADAHVASGSLDGATILLAEDSPETLATLAAFLENAGAEVAPCENPFDAAEAIEDDPDAWDLLITDLEMPGLDGAALAARARKAAPSLPMILCTGAADLKVCCCSGGVRRSLRKPVSEASLVAAARRALASTSTGED